MRLPRIATLALAASTTIASAQTALWSHVSPNDGPQNLQPATLTSAQLKSVALLLGHKNSALECEGPELKEMIEGLQYETIPTPGKQELVLAEAPAGCARGGQGSNGAMWVIRFDGPKPTLLATPDQFSGWLFCVLPTLSHGYPDIVLGWHMSVDDTPLTYMRFDGKLYRSIGTNSLESLDEEHSKLAAKSN